LIVYQLEMRLYFICSKAVDVRDVIANFMPVLVVCTKKETI